MKQPKHGEEYSFKFAITLDELIWINGIDDMNSFMDDRLEEKLGASRLNLTDISYEAEMIDHGSILIKATGIIEDFDVEMDECNG